MPLGRHAVAPLAAALIGVRGAGLGDVGRGRGRRTICPDAGARPGAWTARPELGETRPLPAWACRHGRNGSSTASPTSASGRRAATRDTPHGRAAPVRPARRASSRRRCRAGRVQIGVQGNQWYQNLLVSPEQTVHFCGQLLQERRRPSSSASSKRSAEDRAPPVFVLTHAAGRLPGLAAFLRALPRGGRCGRRAA